MSEQRKGTTKSNGRKQAHDKFYTSHATVTTCLQLINLANYNTVIEPSAGAGAFSNQIPNCIALDLKPEHPAVIQQDFFDYTLPQNTPRPTLVIGNPPFGVQNNLAIKFFNHAATFADTIAFILPLSFKKASIQNKLNVKFSLAEELILPQNAFELNGNPYHVPSVFQIWEKQLNPRVIGKPLTSTKILFIKKEQNPHFYFQRVGGKAGTVGTTIADRSEQSNYFLHIEDETLREDVYRYLQTYSWEDIRHHTVGPRSISKQELLTVLTQRFSTTI